MVSVAEYLGHAVPTSKEPIDPMHAAMCPFADIECMKIAMGKKPICSTRKPDKKIWITCEERLCSTSSDTLTEYQRDILCRIASEVFDMGHDPDNVIYKKEINLELPHKKRMRADYILGTRSKEHGRGHGPRRVILEMQGGGSTSNTGIMTQHVDNWEKDINRTNEGLGKMLPKVRSGENDSWKRQQDQLITKSHIASASGYGFVICVGETLFDYIYDRLDQLRNTENMRDGEGRWNFVLLPMVEVNDGDRIRFDVDSKSAIYTKFHTFTQMLISQGNALPDKFIGVFHTLNGKEITVKR